MWDPGRGRLRALRSLLVGLTVAVIAATSHAVGGGAHTVWLAVVPATGAVAVVTWVLAGRRLGAATLLGLLSVAQVGVHLLSAHLEGHAISHGLPMLTAHLLAAVVSAVLLGRGELLLWWLHAWLRPRLLPSAPHVPTTAAPPFVGDVAPRPAPALLVGGLGRRGPPVVLA